jgi:hypothetical protein
MNKIYSLLTVFFLRKVDVYVTESSIKKPYTIIGQGYINTTFGDINWNQVQRNSVKVGMMKGADAVLIVQRRAVSVLPAYTTTSKTDSIVPFPVTSFHEIFYLKYD